MAGQSLLASRAPSANVHWAFGAVALLLLMLNLLTPSLLHGGLSPNETFLGQGVLYVAGSTNGSLVFGLSNGGHLEFQTIVVALNLTAPTTPGNASTYRHWDRWLNLSEVLNLGFNTSSPSFVVNVTAWYAAPAQGGGSPTVTYGTFAFARSGSGSSAMLAVTPIYPLYGPAALPGGGSTSMWALSALPRSVSLSSPQSSIIAGPASELASAGPTAASIRGPRP